MESLPKSPGHLVTPKSSPNRTQPQSDEGYNQIIANHDFNHIFESMDGKREEDELRTNILNSFTEIIAFYEPDHRIKWLNDAGKKQLGIDNDSYIGKKCYKVWYGAKAPCSRCPVVSMHRETVERITTRNDTRSWLVRHTPLIGKNDKVLGYIEFSEDITEKLKLESLQKELAADSLYINQKNKITIEIKSELDRILEKNKKYSKKNFKRIYDIISSYLRLDNDWNLLIKHFEQIHPDFFCNLGKQFTNLSVSDLKHCACIRLNFDTKETARFFNVKPESVKMSRVRLKKKLGLSRTADLSNFILNF